MVEIDNYEVAFRAFDNTAREVGGTAFVDGAEPDSQQSALYQTPDSAVLLQENHVGRLEIQINRSVSPQDPIIPMSRNIAP